MDAGRSRLGVGLGVWAAVGGLLGPAVQLQQPALASPLARGLALWMALALAVVMVWRMATGRPARRVRARLGLGWADRCAGPGWMLVAALLAWVATDWRAGLRLADRLDPALEMRTVEVTGLVVGLPVWRADGVRFELQVEPPAPAGVPGRLSLFWPAGEPGMGFTAASVPRAGQRWRLPVRLRRPDGLVNPHGVDVPLLLFERGIGAVGTVQVPRPMRPGLAVQPLEATGAVPVDRLRQGLRDRLRDRLGETRAAGLLAALALGDQAAIEREDWAVFRATGVAHLVSISGLHVTLLGWLAGAVLGALWRQRSAWTLWRPAPVVARWGGLAVAAAYALLAGWGVPAQRTVLMLATVALLQRGAWRWPGWRILLAAAVVVTAWDPWALLQPGFWLSFVAVALLMLSGGHDTHVPAAAGTPGLGGWRDRCLASLQALWRTQWVATIGLAPWTLLFFQQVSLVSLLANAVAIPVVTLLVTPLALLGLLAAPLWDWAVPLAEALTGLLQSMAAWPWASLPWPAVPPWAQGLGVVAGGLLVAPLPGRVRLAGLPLLLPMLWPALAQPPAGEFTLLAADIGQGNAVLVRTASRALLYDSGPSYGRHGESGNAGERVLVPLMRALGVRSLDSLVLSHRDSDHSGGAVAVLQAVPVAMMQTALEPDHPLRQQRPHQRCTAGLRWEWDGVRFEFLHPEAADLDRPVLAALRPNAVSCVLRVASRSGRVALLTGDIGVDQELRLLVRQRDKLPADVLLVPHHGSGSSSSLRFLQAVSPTWAIVQAGRHNRYGHPSPAVVERYAEQGIALVRTPRCGAWHWKSADVSHWCAQHLRVRYWHPWRPDRRADDGLDDGPDIAKSSLNDPPPP